MMILILLPSFKLLFLKEFQIKLYKYYSKNNWNLLENLANFVTFDFYKNITQRKSVPKVITMKISHIITEVLKLLSFMSTPYSLLRQWINEESDSMKLELFSIKLKYFHIIEPIEAVGKK